MTTKNDGFDSLNSGPIKSVEDIYWFLMNQSKLRAPQTDEAAVLQDLAGEWHKRLVELDPVSYAGLNFVKISTTKKELRLLNHAIRAGIGDDGIDNIGLSREDKVILGKVANRLCKMENGQEPYYEEYDE